MNGTGRDDALESYLQGLRLAAKLSISQVCERTKIQSRYVEALEAGRFGEVPSNTHLRAFSLSIAQACGGDAERTVLLVRRVLAAAAPAGGPVRGFDTPPPAPAEALRPLTPQNPAAPAPVPARGAEPGRLAADGPALAEDAPVHGLAAASARLRSLPLALLLALLALAGTLSYGTSWGLERWRREQSLRAVAPAAEAEPGPTTSAPSASVQAQAPVQAQAGSQAQAPVQAELAPAPAAPASLELVLRARRDCWLVLEIDGQRLPTVTLRDGDKLRWPVSDRARLLAGNVGALRVWWRGENLGYLGELGVRANALVFERGKAPRYDRAQALALPPGVPE